MFDNFENKSKARKTWRKCIRAGKFDLAEKISNKYDLLNHQSDRVMSFGMVLMGMKKREKK